MREDIKVDVIIINHAFCELNKYARTYLLKIIKEKIVNSSWSIWEVVIYFL